MNTSFRAGSWYRDPYRWLVIAFPLAAVVSGLTTAVLAIRSFDGMVVDDYYKQGLEINRVLRRDARARVLNLGAEVRWDSTRGILAITLLGAADPSTLPTTLSVDLVYATRAGRDRHLLAQAIGHHRYVVSTGDLAPGHWYVHLASADWRITNSMHVEQH
ncbi:MAG: FixH family protein [Gammaproteobacteria bacterium]|nr:FixH family protein [Gammaproteobacteria bacterium]